MSLAPAPGPAARLRRSAPLALDLDGTVYIGGTLFPFSQPFLASMRDLVIGCTFLTNNPSKSAAAQPPPDLVLPSFAEFGAHLRASRA